MSLDLICIVFACCRCQHFVNNELTVYRVRYFFSKSHYIVNTTKARQGHIIQFIENFTYTSKMQSKSGNCIKKTIFLISIENTMDKINVSKCWLSPV